MPAADQANASQPDPPGLTFSVSVSALQHLIIEVLRRPVEFTVGEPLGVVTLRHDERAFDWSTGRLYSKETDAALATLDTNRLTWMLP